MRLNALAHICPLLPNYVKFNDTFTNDTIYDTIQEMAFEYPKDIEGCSFKGVKSCTDLLQPLMTEDGLCFTFNALNSHEIYTNE